MTPSKSPRRRKKIVGGLLITALWLALPALVLAHPLGDFVLNRYSRLALGAVQITLHYAVDMAEIPTFQQNTYLAEQIEKIQSNLHLEVAGRPLSLIAKTQAIDFPPGNGGLDTLRINAEFIADLPSQDVAWQVDYRDENYAGRIGWQEVVIEPDSDVTLLDSTAPTEDLSQGLTVYPQNVIAPEINSAAFVFEPNGLSGAGKTSVSVSAAAVETDQSLVKREDTEFAALINSSLASPTAILLVIIAAFGWGAAHALTPGHGKTIVAAYLVGSRGTVGHAVFLGLTTTVTHTAGVFIIGVLTLFASQYILPEQLYPWLAVGSGVLVVWIGLMLFRGHLRGFLGRGGGHHHDHGHDHSHDHHHHHHYDHDHHHNHDHAHDHDHHHHHGAYQHDHGDGHVHSHMPPGADDTPITWKSLLALGISGGLIPCPAALVVMLSAIALQRVGFGMVLIIAFSFGLAGVLTAIGVLWVKATSLLNRMSNGGQFLDRFPGGRNRVLQLLPVASATFIVLVGLGITLQALIRTGVFVA